MRPKVLHRFYGQILLLETLGLVRGDRQKAELISDEPGIHDTKLRRHFCNALAYICAFDTGSDCVTALALDAQPDITNVLIAANRGVPDDVITFLRDILSILHRIAQEAHDTDTSMIQEDIVQKVVKQSRPRISHYHEVAIDMCKSCLPLIKSARDKLAGPSAHPKIAELDRLKTFLDQYFKPSRSLGSEQECLDLVKHCHSIRSSGMIRSLNSFAAHGQTCQSKFQRLQEILKKLGKHITCSRRLVDAATQLSDEFVLGFNIQRIKASPLSSVSLPPKKQSVESIVSRITSVPAEKDMIKRQLEKRLGKSLAEISLDIKQKYEITQTQTHAELLLLSYIEQNGCQFRDPDDRYIGCSKPACYLCHLFIRYHPSNYSLPDTSNKLYVKWRTPDICSNGEDTSIIPYGDEEMILDKMIQQIKADFKNDVMRAKLRFMHADSSADVTSTVGGPGIGADTGAIDSQPWSTIAGIQSLSLTNAAHAQG
ncbi:hypothetical protein ACJ72_00038 [Emergomyces africanus]|uniref:Uncharacterized protein n=1 Tax=Emergomyces africanus TaxID=1955775 RepID=A0A1B7P9P8_9EURO|nr:hypothetical protein ACJ72_00038 [Emergomyces africanus]